MSQPGPAGTAGRGGVVSAWYMVAVLIVLYFLNSFDRTVLSLMVPHLKHDLAVSDTQVGMLLGMAFALFYGVFGWPMGVLVDRFPRRIVLCCGVLFWSTATFACGLAASYGQLLLARMLLGIGEASLMPAAHALIADRFPARRLGMAMSIFYFGGIFGSSASTALGGIAVAHFSQTSLIEVAGLFAVRGWQMPFIILGAAGFFAGALLFTFREPARASVVNIQSPPFLETLRQVRGPILAIFGSFVSAAVMLFAIVLWTPTFMARSYGWEPHQVGIAYGAMHLAGSGLGTLVFGAIVDRFYARGMTDAHLRVFGGCMVVGAPCALLAFLAGNPITFLILIGLAHFFAFSFTGYASALVQLVSPAAARGRMAGLYVMMLVLFGNGLGPLLLGALSDNVFGPAQLGSAAALLIGVLGPASAASAFAGLASVRRAVAHAGDVPLPTFAEDPTA